jgi:hypothetical protein
MRAIAAKVDSSAFATDEDITQTRAEGAGPGFGSESFSVPGGSGGTGTGGITAQTMPRGAGLNRLFHVFNPSAHARTTITELTVWDWLGDMTRLCFKDSAGQVVPHQLVDAELKRYWDHHYFRVLTAMSPLQYQKRLRLQAARGRMLLDSLDAASAAFEVGYESASQFNREYSRFFGQPPMRDVRALRSPGPQVLESGSAR